jgi:hypothetical protein
MSFNRQDFFIQKRKNEKIIRLPGSIAGNDLALDSIDESEIYLFDHSAQITGDFINNSKLIIGPCAGSVFLRDCNNCTISVACSQLRLRDCKNCVVYLYCQTKSPVIESSEGITFHPFNIAYPGLTQHFQAAQLDTKLNYWNSVFDFTADKTTSDNPHYIIGSAEIELRQFNQLDNSELSADTPLDNIQYSKKTPETVKLTTKAQSIPAEMTRKSSDLASPSNIADFIASIPSPENKQALTATKPIEIIVPKDLIKAGSTNSTTTAAEPTDAVHAAINAGEKKVETKDYSKEYSFSFDTTQQQAQQVVDQNEILASLEEYGQQKAQQEQQTAQIPADSIEIKAAEPDSKQELHKTKIDADSLWKSIVSEEAKPSEKELQRRAREEEHELAQRQELAEEAKKSLASNDDECEDSIDSSFLQFASAEKDLKIAQEYVLEQSEAEKKLKEIEKQTKKEVKKKLQAAAAENQQVAAVAAAAAIASK